MSARFWTADAHRPFCVGVKDDVVPCDIQSHIFFHLLPLCRKSHKGFICSPRIEKPGDCQQDIEVVSVWDVSTAPLLTQSVCLSETSWDLTSNVWDLSSKTWDLSSKTWALSSKAWDLTSKTRDLPSKCIKSQFKVNCLTSIHEGWHTHTHWWITLAVKHRGGGL